MLDGKYTMDDIANMLKAYTKKVDAVMDIVKTLQKDVEYIKKHGTVVNPDNPDADVEGALITDDGCYLMTDDGCYLVV